MYARDVTAVSPIALALFGGRLKIYERHSVVTVEGKASIVDLGFDGRKELLYMQSTHNMK